MYRTELFIITLLNMLWDKTILTVRYVCLNLVMVLFPMSYQSYRISFQAETEKDRKKMLKILLEKVCSNDLFVQERYSSSINV